MIVKRNEVLFFARLAVFFLAFFFVLFFVAAFFFLAFFFRPSVGAAFFFLAFFFRPFFGPAFFLADFFFRPFFEAAFLGAFRSPARALFISPSLFSRSFSIGFIWNPPLFSVVAKQRGNFL